MTTSDSCNNNQKLKYNILFNFQEYEITLNKIQGSLGFTLRKEDDSALGHYVRALVREPALTDGRIRAGDKIIAVSVLKYFQKLILYQHNNKKSFLG